MNSRNKILIVGAGISGIVLAERFASMGDKVVLVEKRKHIGGNCYDFLNKSKILVQKYGPHIFHTNEKAVWEYLSQFTKWIPYEHKVLGLVDEKLVPIPFNLSSLYIFFPKDKAKKIENKLIEKYGLNKKVPILEIKKSKDEYLKSFADFVYQKIYLGYSQKQWGKKPEEMDFSITARVPIAISYENKYFDDKYQGIPKDGYAKMFKRMLKNKNIEVKLSCDYQKIKFKDKYNSIFYTGPIDEFFYFKFGKLKYRCLKVKLQTLNKKDYQPCSVINYPHLKYPFTRITEFKKLTQQNNKKTTIGIEYPGEKGFVAWPFWDKKNKLILEKYLRQTEKIKKDKIYFVGRLAEFKYYNMDQAVKNSLDLFDSCNN